MKCFFSSCMLVFFLCSLCPLNYLNACTTMIVTKGASTDGSTFVAHSDDDDLADQSIIYVPAKDWPKGAKRPVHGSAVANGDLPKFKDFSEPRLVDSSRSPDYAHPGYPKSVPLDYIPQVPHTYAYLDGNYGIVNEYGLMFGECTDGAKVTNNPEPGKRIFYSSELSRVALERCRTARDAIQLIGDLIEHYGYYGTGETLPVADSQEAWVIEMAPSPEGTGGLWVAQRVPDGEFFVAANEFRIRDIVPGNPDQMYARSLFNVVERTGIRSPKDKKKPMDWLTTVSKGEYSHPYYSLRRVWRAFSLAAPSLKLSPWVQDGTTRAYPFSVKPDAKMNLSDIKKIYRDHYEGTEFDLTKGIAAGPFGCPNRYLGPKDPSGDVGDPSVKLEGAWERPISMFYTGYVFINQLKPNAQFPLNVVSWIALNTPAESVFVPLAVAKTPRPYVNANPKKYDPNSAWWTYNLIGEYSNIKYSYMIKDIQSKALKDEESSERIVNDLTYRLENIAKTTPKKAIDEFSKALNQNAERICKDWQNFFIELHFKYNQGFINSSDKMAQKVGYSQDWLKYTNYKQGPTTYRKK
ncbi:MAG: C69 family dipeptidase [Endomicrobium sp.]|uniref:dipeptidase n=1 Tax=Candidatus Endomicrobiellum cubanum TaxID=3242325 RepID=UPI002834CDDE|nr:C69 family dipeptidase [Endomicrobium sp.]